MSKYILPINIYTGIEVEADNLAEAIRKTLENYDEENVELVFNNRNNLNDSWEIDESDIVIKDNDALEPKGEEAEWMEPNQVVSIKYILDPSIY